MTERAESYVAIIVSAVVSLIVSLGMLGYTVYGTMQEHHRIELQLAEREGRNLAAYLVFCTQASEWAEKFQHVTDTNIPTVSKSCREAETKVYGRAVTFLTKRGESL
jgi:hypothetical protein